MAHRASNKQVRIGFSGVQAAANKAVREFVRQFCLQLYSGDPIWLMQICRFSLCYDYVIVLLQLVWILMLDMVHLKTSVLQAQLLKAIDADD